jgi:Carboxypeptidase regulatory-like domain
MRKCLWGVLVAVVILLPSSAWAQASIAGSARDTSGAALPGVTVEASSPVLIEKVRTTVSDERGLFRIVNLPPGTYVVTFALQGFNQVKREGIELSGSFTAQIDVDLSVGGLTETLTVTGASPIVDVQTSDARQRSAATFSRPFQRRDRGPPRRS